MSASLRYDRFVVLLCMSLISLSFVACVRGEDDTSQQACCLPDGYCSLLDPCDCLAANGIAQGEGVTCADVYCGYCPQEPDMDFNGDCRVDMADFAEFTQAWMQCNWLPPEDCWQGVVCVDGQTRPCGSDIGACRKGTETCVNGQWGPCVGSIGPSDEICNNIDDDCDTVIDNVDPRPCSLTYGVCYGTMQECRDGVWQPCDYGPDYEFTETRCDDLDNDCDGIIDENCP